MKRFQQIFIALVLAVLLLPLVGMAWARTDSTTENRELAAFPTLRTAEGGFNLELLPQLGTWFEDHFAYRNQLVAANAGLREQLLAVSGSDQVIVGREGWLFYAGTLPDYQGADYASTTADFAGTATLSERELHNAAHNLSLFEAYVQAQGADFAFAVAPNKNTLYGQYMPGRYLAGTEPTNLERLIPWLEYYDVSYIDLYTPLSEASERVYLKRDTHWNNKGAYIASNLILERFGHSPLAQPTWSSRAEHIGDLEAMLYPANPTPEQQFFAAGVVDKSDFSGSSWRYTNEATSVEDDFITTAGAGDGNILVYRDSFGNALLPWLAANSSQATFSKLVPYDASQVTEQQADHVLIIRAERHISYLAETAPISLPPQLDVDTSQADEDRTALAHPSVEVATDGPYTVFSGCVDAEALQTDTLVYLSLKVGDSPEQVFQAFLTSPDATNRGNGYCIYLPSELIKSGDTVLRVYLAGDDSLLLVQFIEL
jgi:hypothetical protein